MRKSLKNAPLYLIIAILAGSMMQYTSPGSQLIFLSGLMFVFLYEIVKLKRIGTENDKVGIIISSAIFITLIGLMVVGKNYFNMSENLQGILLLIAFLEFILTLLIFGYRIVVKSGDAARVKQFIVPVVMLFLLIVFISVFVLVTI